MFQQNQNQTRRSFFSAVAAAVASLSGGMAWLMGAGGGKSMAETRSNEGIHLARLRMPAIDTKSERVFILTESGLNRFIDAQILKTTASRDWHQEDELDGQFTEDAKVAYACFVAIDEITHSIRSWMKHNEKVKQCAGWGDRNTTLMGNDELLKITITSERGQSRSLAKATAKDAIAFGRYLLLANKA